MTKTQVLMLFGYMRHLWRQFDVPNDPDDLDVMVRVWGDVLGDLDVEVCRATLVAMDREFPPTPQQLRSAVQEMVGPALPGWDEFYAWVRREASRASLYLYDDKPEFRCPWPELEGVITVQDLVDWANEQVTLHDFEMIIQAHVRRRFEPAVQRILRTAGREAPAITAYRTKRTRELDAAEVPLVSAVRRQEPFLGIGEPDGRF